ncbi:hypothetical protein HKX54_02385 [Sulfitobacter sp. M57]|uniref:hypothetical protein n=2 Tax=unclassified Sulfitobacter TaxID=196795 RepID=UPI0023E30EDD|nr:MULTISPECIES: hypothetical protein [unclassified Sulfitobacter]MDF3431838.1 hypothetical protein [Sulfitobacter sp. KE42]MDF3461380.1 hypothetical protein [Sulfitobacter sp. Ks18]MDF3508038.1 hypothetical protein [Sulfitobacter sp. M57]MDF3511935.1 hypothetical protein [Sulfitobacter sp. M36]MDF3523631.1 hypothetical protein [Sulfitobacter sp. S66]MDF3531437.1 hypothetical protein [Sulfitobacter sp. S62]MDF3539251.1 hypothetical protein [Sulfitobacter sp. M62]
MTLGFQILPAMPISAAQVTTAPPELHPDWVAGAYNFEDRVVRQQKVYECQADGVTSDPLIGVGLAPIQWVLIGPSNKMAPFDGRAGTYAERTDGGDLVFRVTPGPFFTSAYITGVVGASVTFRHLDAADNVKRTSSPVVMDFAGHNTPWNVLFAPWEVRASFGFGPLIPLIGDVEVTITPTGGVARVAEIIIGRNRVIGETSPEVDRRYIDNSTYEANAFGEVDITQRAGVPERRFLINMDSTDVPAAERVLAENTGARCAFIPNEFVLDLVTFGYVSDWRFRETVMWDEATGRRLGGAILDLQTRGVK